jgi:hypothetical protein
MSDRYQGLLGVVTERCDLKAELGCSWEEAHAEQERRAKRVRDPEAEPRRPIWRQRSRNRA